MASYQHTSSHGVTYFLHKTEVTLRGGKPQLVYFFAKVEQKAKGTPTDLPAGRVVRENPRNGFITISKASNSPKDEDSASESPGPNHDDATLGAADTIVLDTSGEGHTEALGLVSDPLGQEFIVESFHRLFSSSFSFSARVLERALADPSIPESYFQRLLEEHPELIPGDYFEARSQVVLELADGESRVPDFLLRPVDGLWDVLELKRPAIRMVTRDRRHPKFTEALMNAIQQTRNYAEALADPGVRERLADRYGIETLRPRLNLIVGRSEDIDRKMLRRLSNQTAPDLHVYSWDHVLDINRRRGRLR